jgi:hypothetical protein
MSHAKKPHLHGQGSLVRSQFHKPNRTLSAAARKRISVAQKARWAKRRRRPLVAVGPEITWQGHAAFAVSLLKESDKHTEIAKMLRKAAEILR